MDIEPGQQQLHYSLTEQIGAGGVGFVWPATDTRLDRDVAIKILPEDSAADPDRLARFKREARLLASLNDPHIAAICGLHEAESVRFLAMGLVAGETLHAHIARSGPLDPHEICTIAMQVAAALEAAHGQGVAHRDLKPANLQAAPGGGAKVPDFGLAEAAPLGLAYDVAADGPLPVVRVVMDDRRLHIVFVENRLREFAAD